MYKAVEAFGQLVRALVSLVVLGIVGVGAWIGYRDYYLPSQTLQADLVAKQAEVDQLHTQLTAKQQELDRVATALKLLKVDHRVAQMAVLNQWRREGDNALMTTVGFAEVDEQGSFLDGYRSFTIEGDVVYIDAWVAKFMDEHVENGVPLRSTSLCLFRRAFGEKQRPSDGFPLDAAGEQPLAYGRGKEVSDLERDIWSHFWQYANDPDQAQQVGLRAVQGEAPSIRLMPDRIYWVYLRASDGLTIKATTRNAAPVADGGSSTGVQPAGYTEESTAAEEAQK
jgi:hypothetical protein